MNERPDVARVDQLVGTARFPRVVREIAGVRIEHRHAAPEVAACVKLGECRPTRDQFVRTGSAENGCATDSRVADEREKPLERIAQAGKAAQLEPMSEQAFFRTAAPAQLDCELRRHRLEVVAVDRRSAQYARDRERIEHSRGKLAFDLGSRAKRHALERTRIATRDVAAKMIAALEHGVDQLDHGALPKNRIDSGAQRSRSNDTSRNPALEKKLRTTSTPCTSPASVKRAMLSEKRTPAGDSASKSFTATIPPGSIDRAARSTSRAASAAGKRCSTFASSAMRAPRGHGSGPSRSRGTSSAPAGVSRASSRTSGRSTTTARSPGYRSRN